jgi:hypothetical protein
MGQVVVEHLSLFVSAFVGAIDKIATARPATMSDEAFMAIFSQIPGRQTLSRTYDITNQTDKGQHETAPGFGECEGQDCCQTQASAGP